MNFFQTVKSFVGIFQKLWIVLLRSWTVFLFLWTRLLYLCLHGILFVWQQVFSMHQYFQTYSNPDNFVELKITEMIREITDMNGKIPTWQNIKFFENVKSTAVLSFYLTVEYFWYILHLSLVLIFSTYLWYLSLVIDFGTSLWYL